MGFDAVAAEKRKLHSIVIDIQMSLARQNPVAAVIEEVINVNHYGMQHTLLGRYGIKTHAVNGRDFCFVNGDENDFRYSNLKIINPYFGVELIDKNGTEHYKVRIHIHGNITVGNYTNAIDAAIAYNKAVDLAHQAGISKNFPENYIEELSASSYADIYQQISLSPKYLSYLKGLPRK